MCTALQDDAASAPSDPLLQAVAEGARLRGRVGRWLRRLSKIGADLTERLGWIADSRAKTGPVEGGIDLQLGWALVSRAARWSRALRTRLRALANAAKEPAQPSDLDISWRDAGRVPRGPPVRKSQLRYGSTHCIEGMKTYEVVAQICADLAEASTMLRATKAERVIARIAKAARALLAGPAETWTKLPAPVFPGGAWDDAAEPARQDAPMRLAAPDSG